MSAARNRRFAHLLPEDIKVWERFLSMFPDEFAQYDYDVRVGYGRDPGIHYDPNLRQMGIDLSQRRIDAVGHKPGSLTVIEITHSAGLKAIGQLLAYPILYGHAFRPRVPIFPLLVCGELQTDVDQPLADLHIPYYIV